MMALSLTPGKNNWPGFFWIESAAPATPAMLKSGYLVESASVHFHETLSY